MNANGFVLSPTPFLPVMPAQAGIQRLLIEEKTLDPGQKHAGMTFK